MKKMMMAANPYLEALRYMDNAKESLQKAGKENGQYQDVKYVRTAAGTAYNGVLIALDAYLQQKEGTKLRKPKSIEDYSNRIAKQNKKLLTLLNSVYDALHILGYYHGTHSVSHMSLAFQEAYQIIEYVKDFYTE